MLSTVGYYDELQTGTQVVYIKSSESVINISLPQLVPLFQQEQGTSSKPMFYQIKSILLPNRYYNLEANDEVEFSASLSWYPIINEIVQPLYTVPINDALDPWFLPIATEDQSINAIEFIDKINVAIMNQTTYWSTIINQSPPPIAIRQLSQNKNITSLYHIFKNIRFDYDPQSQKMRVTYAVCDNTLEQVYYQNDGITIDPSLTQFYTNNSLTTSDNIYISSFELHLRPSRHLSIERQTAIAKMIGCLTSYQTFTGGSQIQVPTYTQIFKLPITTYLQSQFLAAVDDTTFMPLQNKTTYSMYGDTVMKMCKYDDIYIRINGVSNIWWPNGRRTDVLDIIPINSSYGDIPQEREFPARIYQIKESQNAITSLSVKLTDENGNLITFIDNYTLKLAFFFTRL